MLIQFLKTSGLDQLEIHSIVLLIMGVSAFCLGFGWLASWVSRAGSTGVGGNAVILLMSMAGGLIAFNTVIEPLQKSQATLLVMVAVAAAITGLLLVRALANIRFDA